MRLVLTTALVVAALCATANAEKLSPNCYERTAEACTELPPHALPTTPEEFIKLRDEIAKDPWGGASMYTYALMVWAKDRPLGDKLLVLAVSEAQVEKVKKGEGTYKGYVLKGNINELLRVFEKNKHCARSYAVGSSPDNDYKLDEKSVALRFRKQDAYVGTIESGTYKVFVCSSGADSCRPITTTRNKNGIWKADEMSSLAVGCKPTKSSLEPPKEQQEAAEDL